MAAPKKTQGLCHADRLHSKREFEAVYLNGEQLHCANGIVTYLPNDLGIARLGLSVSRKIGHAATRNRVKRRIREAFRRNSALRSRGVDIVVQPRRNSQPAWEKNFLAGLHGVFKEISELEQRLVETRRNT